MNVKGRLIYLGHASFRLESGEGKVIYIDPFAGTGYEAPADLIISTHGHPDHSNFEIVPKKDSCIIISNKEALLNEVYQTFPLDDIYVRAVPAYNEKHARDIGVGYLVSVDGLTIYFSGDTSKIPEMSLLANENITYALFPTDGFYNMGPEEASECAEMVQPWYAIPIHTCPFSKGIFDEESALRFKYKNRIILRPNDILDLQSATVTNPVEVGEGGEDKK